MRAQGSVQALDVGGVDGRRVLGLAQHGLDLAAGALHNTPQHADDVLLRILLDDLRDQDAVPGPQDRSTAPLAGHRLAKDLLNHAHVSPEPIGAEQHGPAERTGTHTLDQLPQQVTIALRTQDAAQPQARTDLQGTGYPDDATLLFDAQLVQLDLAQLTRLLHQPLMHLLAVLTGAGLPLAHRAFIELERHDDRLHRTAIRHERDHQRHQLGRPMQPVEHRASTRTKRLAADPTDVALLLATMNADVALSSLSACRTVRIRAECCLGVHGLTAFPLDLAVQWIVP